jgi:DNA-binding transcriptional regulator YiaG
MAVVTDRDNGLFPLPGEIKLHCSCPDWAVMCKHVAAVLYGVGARLDVKPELLFRLRGVDHEDLIGEEVGLAAVFRASQRDGAPRIAEGDLSHLFGIEMAEPEAPGSTKAASKRAASAGKTLPHQRRPAKNGKEQVSRSAGVRQARKKIGNARRTNTREQEKAAARATPGRPPEKYRRKTLGAAVAGTRAVTGKAVSKLRGKFGMTQAQFARLLGVSQPTVGNWEKAEGQLNLRTSTRKAWNAVSKLSNVEAWQRSRDISRRSE